MIDQSHLSQMRWDEQAIAVESFHRGKQDENGIPSAGRLKDGWSVRDTARVLGKSVGWVCETLKLAKAILEKKSLRRFESRNTALAAISNTKAYLPEGTEVIVSNHTGTCVEATIIGHGFIKKEHCYIISLLTPVIQNNSPFYYFAVRHDKVREKHEDSTCN